MAQVNISIPNDFIDNVNHYINKSHKEKKLPPLGGHEMVKEALATFKWLAQQNSEGKAIVSVGARKQIFCALQSEHISAQAPTNDSDPDPEVVQVHFELPKEQLYEINYLFQKSHPGQAHKLGAQQWCQEALKVLKIILQHTSAGLSVVAVDANGQVVSHISKPQQVEPQ